MPNKKRSKIWTLTNEEFTNLIKNSVRMRDVLAYFGMQNKGSNFQTVQRRIKELNLDTSHFMSRTESSSYIRKATLENTKDKFVEHSVAQRKDIKRYVIELNLIPYECNDCQNQGEWNGKKLSLQLEHKNGISDDNRLENLCFLCPNCHSQTDTYAGKNVKRVK